MLKHISAPHKIIIINATNIGFKLNGIGVYSLNIIRELAAMETDFRFIIYLNKSSRHHIGNISFPENFSIKWVSDWVSPDRKFTGHLLRLLYSNYLSIKHLKLLQVNTSPLEICVLKSNQIVTVHDVIPLLFKQYHKKQYLFFKILLKYVLKYVKTVITPSIHTKELLKIYYKLPEEKIKVVYPGVRHNQTSENLGPEISSRYILYIGRINNMKNIEGIIKSFLIVNETFKINLVIAGDDRKKFMRILYEVNCNHEIRERITFIESVSQEQATNLLKNASLFLYPTHYEGFGLPPLEAMINGCPVIASDNSSIPEVCGDAVYYINPKNEYAIAEGICELLKDVKQRNQLIRKGFENVQKFSWEKTAQEHLLIWNRSLQFQEITEKIEPQVFKPEFLGIKISD